MTIYDQSIRMTDFTLEVDARGLNCPLPILRAKKGLNSLNSGDVLKLVATDPGSVDDVPPFVKHANCSLLHSQQQDGEYIFFIQKT